jgi:hypothetical protein
MMRTTWWSRPVDGCRTLFKDTFTKYVFRLASKLSLKKKFLLINMGVYKCSIFAYSKTVENLYNK